MTNITNGIADISPRQAALAAGCGLVLMCLLAPFAYFSVIQKLVVQGDAATTAANIMASESIFRASIVSLMVVVILDIVVAWGLYVLLKPMNKSLSLLAAWFRLVYAAVFAVAIANLYNVLPLLNDAGYIESLGTDQINVRIMLLLDSYRIEWDTGLIIFGFSLCLLGFLVFKSGPRILGILVALSGVGYIVDPFGKILLTDYSLTVGLYTFAGEILLIFWLFWIGIKGVPATLDRTFAAEVRK